MTRTPSSYRVQRPGGKTHGYTATKRDKAIMESLARWYCLSTDQIIRTVVGHDTWERISGADNDWVRTDEYRRTLNVIKQRLWRMSAIIENPGNHTGPVIQKTLSHTGQTAWYCTPYGATLSSVPWTLRSQISANYTDHAMMAADIGMQLESMGYRVYSERETATGTDHNGDLIETPIPSYYYTSSGQKTEKRPDLVIPSEDGTRFIAVEVERDRNRALSTYTEKLRAYEMNPAISAVWYVCEFPNTVRRVGGAADNVFGARDYPLRINLLPPDHQGWKRIPNLTQNTTLMDDLRRLA